MTLKIKKEKLLKTNDISKILKLLMDNSILEDEDFDEDKFFEKALDKYSFSHTLIDVNY